MLHTETFFAASPQASAEVSVFVDGQSDATFHTSKPDKSTRPIWDEDFYYYGCVLPTSTFPLLEAPANR